jgi:hypothetical protein
MRTLECSLTAKSSQDCHKELPSPGSVAFRLIRGAISHYGQCGAPAPFAARRKEWVMPYAELPPLTDDEFAHMRSGRWSPDDFAPEERRQKTHAYFEQLLYVAPHEWQAIFDDAAALWLQRMKQDNGRVTQYNPTGQRFRRRELKLMAQQWGFDSMGVNFDDHAETADELLERAQAMARLGALMGA